MIQCSLQLCSSFPTSTAVPTEHWLDSVGIKYYYDDVVVDDDDDDDAVLLGSCLYLLSSIVYIIVYGLCTVGRLVEHVKLYYYILYCFDCIDLSCIFCIVFTAAQIV